MARKVLFQKKVNFNPNCTACGLHSDAQCKNMEVHGEGKKEILIWGEVPTATDDRRGRQFSGSDGERLRDTASQFGIDIDEDCWTINSCNCYTEKKITNEHLAACRPNVDKVIQEKQPRFIWLMGNTAVKSYLIGRSHELRKDTTVNRWRRQCVPDMLHNAYVIPMYHPEWVLRGEEHRNDIPGIFFERDMRYAVSCLQKDGRPQDHKYNINNVKVLLRIDDVISEMRDILQQKPRTNLDYECSTLKPYRRGTIIHTASIYNAAKGYSIAFPIAFPRRRQSPPYIEGQYEMFWSPEEYQIVRQLMVAYLSDPEIKKSIHNAKFETNWTEVFFGCPLEGVDWCSQVNQHILDCRQSFTALKYQAFARWGVEGYEEEMRSYLDEDAKGNDWNRLHMMPLDKLCLYNGRDTLLGHSLYLEQFKEFRLHTKHPVEDLNQCRVFFEKGWKALAKAERHGMGSDDKYYAETTLTLTDRLKQLEKSIRDSPESLKYRQVMKKELNPRASGAVAKALTLQGIKVEKVTTSGDESADKAILQKIDLQFCRDILEYRKVYKVLSTYISGFLEESTDGVLHPFFNLHIARTGRSSCNNPNIQNIPVRDKESKAIVRKGIVPRKGRKILEVDFSGLEVHIAGCYTRDPTLVAYLHDKTTDMHRDEGVFLFKLASWQISKDIRFYIKNCWVFPQFYGSYWKNCAKNLWANIVKEGLRICVKGDDPRKPTGPTAKEWLAGHGIKTLSAFEEHCKAHEKVFWGRYKVFKKWQAQVRKFYRENLYVDSFFGFRRNDYMTNEVINSSIQGSAFHCLLWCFIRLTEIAEEEGWSSFLMGQIHDSVLIDLDPAEEQHIIATIQKVMTEELPAAFDWINVPLDVEMEVTGVDQPWYYKEKIDLAEAA